MIQRHRTHPAGTFLACSGCGREPMHIISAGVTTSTQSDPRCPSIGSRHHIECPRCNRRTAAAATLAEAETAWGEHAQLSLPLRQQPRNARSKAA